MRRRANWRDTKLPSVFRNQTCGKVTYSSNSCTPQSEAEDCVQHKKQDLNVLVYLDFPPLTYLWWLICVSRLVFPLLASLLGRNGSGQLRLRGERPGRRGEARRGQDVDGKDEVVAGVNLIGLCRGHYCFLEKGLIVCSPTSKRALVSPLTHKYQFTVLA